MRENENIRDVLLARTAARIGRHADKKHEEKHTKMRKQTSMCLFVQPIAQHPHACVPIRACMCECMITRLTDLSAQSPLRNGVALC